MHQSGIRALPGECVFVVLYFSYFLYHPENHVSNQTQRTLKLLEVNSTIKHLNSTKHPLPPLIYVSGSKGSGVQNPRIPLGLNLEQARELGRGNAIHQLQENYQALSARVT